MEIQQQLFTTSQLSLTPIALQVTVLKSRPARTISKLKKKKIHTLQNKNHTYIVLEYE